MALKRKINLMPQDVRDALNERGLIAAYESRPPCQKNDYLVWITRAKCEATRSRRLAQLLDELAAGDRYMDMAYCSKQRHPNE